MKQKIRAHSFRIVTLDTRRVQPEPVRTERLYQSREWRTLVAQIIERRGRRCEKCGATPRRVIADHIHELRDGGAPLDASNIMLTCYRCHGIKTNQRQAERMARRW